MKITQTLARTACVTALVSLAALSSAAQTELEPRPQPNVPVAPTPPLPSEDYRAGVGMPNPDAERFISKLSTLQSEEARISAVASQRATNDQVRAFADRIRAASHDRDQELAQLAQARSILLPTGKDSGDMADENQKWQEKDADDFDGDYVKRIIRVQKNSVDTLEDYVEDNNSDPELAAFARKHVQALQESVRQAESLENQLD